MKGKMLSILFFVLSFSLCEGQSWLWAKQGILRTTNDGSEGWSVATDLAGNAFLTGEYSGDTLSFGSDTLIYLFGGFQTYLVKYSPTGNVLWARQSTPSSYSVGYSYSVASDLYGNSYITGNFGDSITFGTHTLNKPGACFLVKYSPNGNALWARQAIGFTRYGGGIGKSVCTDKDANIIITGYFADTISFGSFQLEGRHKYSSSIFVTKYDSNANVLWAKQSIDSSKNANGSGYCVTSDKEGNVYMSGYFNDTIYFGTTPLIAKANGGYGDVFFVKYNSAGNLIWAKQATLQSGRSGGEAFGITTDKYLNLYITGSFIDTLSFGSGKLISNTNGLNLFVAKFDSAGNNIWAKATIILDTTAWTGYTLSLDTNNNLYLSAGGTRGGAHEYRIVFDADTFKTYIGTDDGASLVLKLDTSGKLICGVMVAGGGDDNNAIVVNPSGNDIYFGGDLDNNVVFGSDTLNHPSMHEVPFLTKWLADCISTNIKNEVDGQTEKINLFPNPSTGRFTIAFAGTQNFVSGRVEIYNVMGQKIVETQCIASLPKLSINLTNQPNGIYLYRVISEEGNLIGEGKVIIEK